MPQYANVIADRVDNANGDDTGIIVGIFVVAIRVVVDGILRALVSNVQLQIRTP